MTFDEFLEGSVEILVKVILFIFVAGCFCTMALALIFGCACCACCAYYVYERYQARQNGQKSSPDDTSIEVVDPTQQCSPACTDISSESG